MEIDKCIERLDAYMNLGPLEKNSPDIMRWHVRALIAPAVAARDAQWREMLGEPEGWVRDQRGTYEGPATLDPLFLLGPLPPDQTSNRGATYTPLYAIKETP